MRASKSCRFSCNAFLGFGMTPTERDGASASPVPTRTHDEPPAAMELSVNRQGEATMNGKTTRDEMFALWHSMERELRAHVARKLRQMPCPREFRGPCGTTSAFSPVSWHRFRYELAADDSFVDDVMNEATYTLLRRVEDDESFPKDADRRRGFAYMTAKWTAYTLARKAVRGTGFSLEAPEAQENAWEAPTCTGLHLRSPEAIAIGRTDAADLLKRLSELSPEELELIAVACDGADFTEFARATDTPPGTVRARWFRLRKEILAWPEAQRLRGLDEAA